MEDFKQMCLPAIQQHGSVQKWRMGWLVAAFMAALPVSGQADIYFNAKVAGPVTNIYATDLSGNVRKITDNRLWRDLTPQVSANGDVVFMSNREPDTKVDLNKRSENYNLFWQANNEAPLKQLTNSAEQDLLPQLDPSEENVTFLRQTDKNVTLMLLSLTSGTERKLLTADTILGAAWASSHEVLIAVKEANGSRILKLDINSGKQITVLTDQTVFSNLEEQKRPSDPTHLLGDLIVSPDSKQLAFISHPLKWGESRQLFVLDLATNHFQRLSDPTLHVQAPVKWSKDGQSVLFSALKDYQFGFDDTSHRKTYQGSMQIFQAHLSGDTRQLTNGDHLHSKPVFSPEGDQVAYLFAEALGDARSLALQVLNLKNGEVTELYQPVSPHSVLSWN